MKLRRRRLRVLLRHGLFGHPAAPQSLVQAHIGIEQLLTPFRIAKFHLKQGALAVQDFEIAGDPFVIALLGKKIGRWRPPSAAVRWRRSAA